MDKEVSHEPNTNLNLIFESHVLSKLWDNLCKQMFYIYLNATKDPPRIM